MDLALCDRLAARARGGDRAARRDLVQHLWPVWRRIVQASRSLGPFAKSRDHVDNVVGSLVEKIGREDGRALDLHAAWRERHPEKTFEDWIHIITANAVKDYVRRQLGAGPSRGAEGVDGERPLPSAKRLLNEFSVSPHVDHVGVRPPMTAAQTARQMLEFAREHLAEDQRAALNLWLEGADFDEIGDELGLPASAPQKLVRAAIANLRRAFSESPAR
jgi:DNA-directed RNA polymerase specialized sigma24 family protein